MQHTRIHGSFQGLALAGISDRVAPPVTRDFRSLKSSLKTKDLKRTPSTMLSFRGGGRSYLWSRSAADRRPSFAANKSELNRESPRGWGVPKSLQGCRSADRLGSHTQIFFVAQEF